MDFGEIISNSLKYPTKGIGKVILLGIILAIPIVNFIGWGYLLRIMRATFTGFDELPDFDEVGELFVDGLKIFVILILAAIPLLIIYGIIEVIYYGSYFGLATDFVVSFAVIIILYAILFLLIYPFVGMYSVRSITLMASRRSK